MWKPFALIFFALTLAPGVLLVLGVAITGRLDDFDGGGIAAVVWLLVVGVIFCSGIRAGYGEAVRAERRARGRCIACGYDVRASAGRCPECGADTAATIVS